MEKQGNGKKERKWEYLRAMAGRKSRGRRREARAKNWTETQICIVSVFVAEAEERV